LQEEEEEKKRVWDRVGALRKIIGLKIAMGRQWVWVQADQGSEKAMQNSCRIGRGQD